MRPRTYIYWILGGAVVAAMVPLINNQGVVTEGSYRGIEVGYTKTDVIIVTTAPAYGNKLKIISYISRDGEATPVFSENCSEGLAASNIWHLYYQGIYYQESVTLRFDKNKVVRILFSRETYGP